MPDRIIRDRCRRSGSLQQLSDAAERAWWRLTVAVDDYGRFEAHGEVLLSMLFIRKPPGWTLSKMLRVIEEWTRPGPPDDPDPLVHLYRVAGDLRIYGHAVKFGDHQRERDSKPKFPDPPCGNSPQRAAKCSESLQSAAYSEGRRPKAEDPRSSSRSFPSLNGFQALWKEHPGPKGAKSEAWKVYQQVKPPAESVEALKAQVQHKIACDRLGAFYPQLPHLHRWLKKRRWEDEIPPLPKSKAQALWDEAQEEKKP